MLIYQYTDTYIVSNVDIADIEIAETKALADLDKQGITDTLYLEEMCKALVYIDLGGKQLESEGMNYKVAHYRKEYDRYSRMDLFDATDEGVFSGTLERG